MSAVLLSSSLPLLLGSLTPWGNASTMVDVSMTALLAQGEAATPNLFASFLPIALMAMLAYFLFVAPQRAKDKRYSQMIADLKENDHVITTGGLHGVVTSIQRDAGRMTLRLDDATGAKVRVSLWAIDSVVTEED